MFNMHSVKKDVSKLYWNVYELFPTEVTCIILEYAGLAGFGHKSSFWVINW